MIEAKLKLALDYLDDSADENDYISYSSIRTDFPLQASSSVQGLANLIGDDPNEITGNGEFNGIVSSYSFGKMNDDGTPVTISMSGNIRFLILKFNKYEGAYATRVKINNAEYVNGESSMVWRIVLSQTSKEVNLKILDWSDWTKKIAIDSILAKIDVSFEKNEFSELKIGKELTSGEMPSFNLIGQYGSVIINDSKKILYTLSQAKMIGTNTKIRILIDNKVINTLYLKELNTNSDNRRINIEMNDLTEKLDNVYVPKVRLINNITALDALRELTRNHESQGLYGFECVDDETSTYLENIVVEEFYVYETKTLRQLLDEFCSAYGVAMYIGGSDGDVIKVVKYV